MRLIVRLCERGDTIVQGMHLPLRLRLVYDDSESNPVLKQEETLKILGNAKQFIDPENGEAVIKFRFEDVSKNHQGLAFKLEISPDARRLSDTAPVLTPGIIVRSKRNKRQSSPARKKIGSQGQFPPISSTGMYHHSPSVEEDSNDQAWDVNRRDIGPREALAQIVAWSKDVTKVLPSLKWNLVSIYVYQTCMTINVLFLCKLTHTTYLIGYIKIGYCQHADGSPDYSKPNHVMPYPNDCISRYVKWFPSFPIQK